MILDLRTSGEIPDLKPLFQKSSTCLFLWKIPSSLPASTEDFLSPRELNRWQEQSLSERQHQFLASRYYTKTLLGKFLGIKTSSFDFESRGEGKLFLPTSLSTLIDFNFSHTADLFFLGVSLSHHIGVDLEAKVPKKNMSQIAERLFSSQERHWIHFSEDRFFRLWSLKEAVIKAAGGGVFKHVQDIEFFAQGEELKIQRLPSDFGAIDSWQIFENPFPGFSCAWALKARI